MCGRYYVDLDTVRTMEELVGRIDWQLRGRTDIHPSEQPWILNEEQGRIAASRMKWGFENPHTKGLLINARAETVTERPAFRESVLHRRCIIPAKGFYEWNKAGEKAEFYKKDASPLFMAGCWKWAKGTPMFVILTTEANPSVASVHERMPLILEGEELRGWLAGDRDVENFLRKIPSPLEKEQEYEQQTLDFSALMR